MPADVKRARTAALSSLYGVGDDEDAPGYTTAIDTIRDWIDSEMPSTLYYDDQSGYVSEDQPEGYEDDEGNWVEPDYGDYREYGQREIKRVVFGALVSDGGL